MTLYDQICKEYQRIIKKISEIEQQLASLPPGFLFISRCGKYYSWFHSHEKVQTYIPKKDRHFAEQLAAKKFLSLRLSNLLHEKKAIEAYLKIHVVKDEKLHALFTDDSGYKELLDSYYKPVSQDLLEWMNSTFEQNPMHPEDLVHKGISGNLLRSKSEAIIDTFLYQNHLPYRYECKLVLGRDTLYPDFTIRHPKTGEVFYWEHFGLMDDPSYYQKVFSKLRLYTSHKIIPSINLITTYETKENPLTVDVVEKIIQHYFL